MTEAMPFLQKYDITFLRPPTIGRGHFSSLFSHAEPREDPPGDVVPDILPG